MEIMEMKKPDTVEIQAQLTGCDANGRTRIDKPPC